MYTSETFWLLLGCALVVGYIALVLYIGWDLVHRDLARWAKVAWVVSFFLFPLLSVILYVITRGLEPHPSPGLGQGQPRP